jgi:hypothetical protein
MERDDTQLRPVPDAVMEQVLASTRLLLEACWACSDCDRAPGPQNPKNHIGEALEATQKALIAAVSADGADAVVGYSMVAGSMARKALTLRAHGQTGLAPDQVPQIFRHMFGPGGPLGPG